MGETAANAETAFSAVRDELQNYTTLRPYQALVVNLATELTEILDDLQDRHSEKLTKIRKIVSWHKKARATAYQRIAKDVVGEFKSKNKFVVFGYSDCVLEALGTLRRAIAGLLQVYVFESRNKSQYGLDNTVEYCDGVEYARKIRELGFDRVRLASDVSAVYTLTAVNPGVLLLGADAIDRSGDLSETIGSASIALAAKHYGVNVYVLAEGAKVCSELNLGDERDNDWLTNDDRITRTLEKDGIELCKPLNEKLPSSLVTGFFTEHGLLNPDQFRKTYGGSTHNRKPAGGTRRKPSAS